MVRSKRTEKYSLTQHNTSKATLAMTSPKCPPVTCKLKMNMRTDMEDGPKGEQEGHHGNEGQ